MRALTVVSAAACSARAACADHVGRARMPPDLKISRRIADVIEARLAKCRRETRPLPRLSNSARRRWHALRQTSRGSGRSIGKFTISGGYEGNAASGELSRAGEDRGPVADREDERDRVERVAASCRFRKARPRSNQMGRRNRLAGRFLRRATTHSHKRLPRIRVPSRSTHKTGEGSLAAWVPAAEPIKRSSQMTQRNGRISGTRR